MDVGEVAFSVETVICKMRVCLCMIHVCICMMRVRVNLYLYTYIFVKAYAYSSVTFHPKVRTCMYACTKAGGEGGGHQKLEAHSKMVDHTWLFEEEKEGKGDAEVKLNSWDGSTKRYFTF